MNPLPTPTPYIPRLDVERPAATGYVPAIVDAALTRGDKAFMAACRLPHGTDSDNALRAERLAAVCARQARWWDVLADWVFTPAGRPLPLVFGDAARRAAGQQRDSARFWRDTAADWRARAEHRPTSDAAGALSNHHELGIPA